MQLCVHVITCRRTYRNLSPHGNSVLYKCIDFSWEITQRVQETFSLHLQRCLQCFQMHQSHATGEAQELYLANSIRIFNSKIIFVMMTTHHYMFPFIENNCLLFLRWSNIARKTERINRLSRNVPPYVLDVIVPIPFCHSAMWLCHSALRISHSSLQTLSLQTLTQPRLISHENCTIPRNDTRFSPGGFWWRVAKERGLACSAD